MSPKLKCQQDWNITKTAMSPELKCHQNWNITFKKMLPKLQCHKIYKCPKNPNLSHNQNPGDRHRSLWSCLRECSPPSMCHMSYVTCHMSHFMCHMSHFTCHMAHVTCKKMDLVLELVDCTVFTRANIDRKCVLLVLQAPVPWIFSKSSLANW